MKISPSEQADDLGLHRIHWISSPGVTNIDVAEVKKQLADNPGDILSRAKLLANITRRQAGNLEAPSEEQYEHISWFVKNIPNSRLCGTRLCFVSKVSPYYPDIRKLWLLESFESKSLMCRINAALLFIANNDREGSTELKTFFNENLDNIWVQALIGIPNAPHAWNEKVAHSEAERLAKRSHAICDLSSTPTTAELNHIAAESSLFGKTAGFRNARSNLQTKPSDLRSIAVVFGYTFSRYMVDTLLRFDPELAEGRFRQMCWCISNIPYAEFLESSFAMDPFFGIESFNKVLSSLWLEAICRYSDLEQVIVNASTFCVKLEVESQALSKQLSTKLKEIPKNSAIFKRIRRRYRR